MDEGVFTLPDFYQSRQRVNIIINDDLNNTKWCSSNSL